MGSMIAMAVDSKERLREAATYSTVIRRIHNISQPMNSPLMAIAARSKRCAVRLRYNVLASRDDFD